MGTSNFYSENTSKVFAIEIEEDYELEDLKYNLREHFNKNKDFTECDEYETNYNRNFPGKLIGKIELNETHYNIDIDITFEIIVRAGYYSGVNLDFGFSFNIDGYDYDDINHDDINQRTQKFIDKKYDNTVKYIEQIFKQHSEPLTVIGTASNGETFYKKDV